MTTEYDWIQWDVNKKSCKYRSESFEGAVGRKNVQVSSKGNSLRTRKHNFTLILKIVLLLLYVPLLNILLFLLELNFVLTQTGIYTQIINTLGIFAPRWLAYPRLVISFNWLTRTSEEMCLIYQVLIDIIQLDNVKIIVVVHLEITLKKIPLRSRNNIEKRW